MRTCKDVTALTLQSEDRTLTTRERLGVHMHMLICKACPKFAKQVTLLRKATAQWRKYSEE
jgi:hypothetical protein